MWLKANNGQSRISTDFIVALFKTRNGDRNDDGQDKYDVRCKTCTNDIYTVDSGVGKTVDEADTYMDQLIMAIQETE